MLHYSRNQKTDEMFMGTSYPKKLKFKNLEPIEKAYTNTSPNDISRTSTDWKRQAGKQTKIKVHADTMPDLLAFNSAKNEQSGSIDPFTRKSSQNPNFDKMKSELKHLSEVDSNFQPPNLNSDYVSLNKFPDLVQRTSNYKILNLHDLVFTSC